MAFLRVAALLLVLPALASAFSIVRPDWSKRLLAKDPTLYSHTSPALFNLAAARADVGEPETSPGFIDKSGRRKIFSWHRSKPAFIMYHGGPVMPEVNVYIIYYGNWSSDAKALIEAFISALGEPGSHSGVGAWWATTQRYWGRGKGLAREYAGKKVTLAGTVDDNYSLGSNVTLGDMDVQSIVDSHVGDGQAFAYDPLGNYMVLVSEDVQVQGLCSEFCGYHNYYTSNSTQMGTVYSLIGDANQCLQGCAAQSNSPNGQPGIDGTISIIAHELAEAATDMKPGSGWLTPKGYENADLCAWNFGNFLHKAQNSAGSEFFYNLQSAVGQKFLVQLNWMHLTQHCAIRAL